VESACALLYAGRRHDDRLLLRADACVLARRKRPSALKPDI